MFEAVTVTYTSLQILRRGLVLDLSVAFGLGTTMGYFYWYGKYILSPDGHEDEFGASASDQHQAYTLVGYHVPSVRRRDLFYAKLEEDRVDKSGTV